MVAIGYFGDHLNSISAEAIEGKQIRIRGFSVAHRQLRSMIPSMRWILFFDGDCAVCSKSVRWVARLDKKAGISFAPLHGELAGKLGLSHHAAASGGSMVLRREVDGKVFTESDSWIELAHALGGFWRVFILISLIPKSCRDGFYRWIARNRYRWFGRAKACQWADPELRKRLLD
jgi:predicted DCC family thiol-disulfide oxidoreductase YuxK